MSISQRDGVPLELTGWNMTGFPLTNYSRIEEYLKDPMIPESVHISKNGMLTQGPVIFRAAFDITDDEIYDTYLDVSGWGKVNKLKTLSELKMLTKLLWNVIGYSLHKWFPPWKILAISRATDNNVCSW